MSDQYDPSNLVNLLRTLQAEETSLIFQLVADRLAHDTGSILHALAGTASLLEENPAGDQRLLVVGVRRESQRLERAIVRLLEFLRGLDAAPTRFHPADVLASLVQATQPYLHAQGVQLTLGRLGRRAVLVGRPELFMELVWKFLSECTAWADSTDARPRPEVRICWTDTAGGGHLRFHTRKVRIPDEFRMLIAKSPRCRDILLQSFPTPWLIMAALIDRFQGRLRLLRRPPADWTVTLIFKGAPPHDE
ncbi:MAG TPA: hypothetical protein PLN27_01125 [Acidobacteriota bacterium]|nr:hypothetical protein [Acidobacteriota bacterium]HQK86002.1 hypothetical protein [Acidobacteriota bacterium]